MSVQNLVIRKGSTFIRVIRWESSPYVYKAIQSIVKGAPAVVNATSHGLPDGWRVAVVSVEGMEEINARNAPPKSADFLKAMVVTPDQIELNTVNSSGFTDHVPNTGYLQYLTPVDLTGFTARMKIKDKVGGAVLEELTTENLKIVIDELLKTITLNLSATETEALTFTKGRYDLELVSPTGVVNALLEGQITVEQEVTT